jgi:hypothetical protein
MLKGKRVVILSVRVDQPLADAVRQLADADDRPVSNYVERLLRKHVSEMGIDLSKPAKPEKKGRKA